MLRGIFITAAVTWLIIYGMTAYLVGAHGAHQPIVENPYINTPTTHGLCAWWNTDLNNDCNHNPADQGRLAQAIILGTAGEPGTWTPTSTPTATFTNTPTYTPTATNNPTATPDTFTVAELIDQTEGDHDGTLCTPPANYDWGTEGRGHYSAPGGSITNIKWWGTAQWASCEGSEAASTYINLRNWASYSWNGTDWGSSYGSSPNNWCNYLDPTTNNGVNEDCTGDASAWLMPVDNANYSPDDRSLHWASASLTMRGGALCHFVIYEAKKTGPGAVMVNTGFDHYIGAEGYSGDAWVGSYVLLTTSYQWIGGSNCSSTVLSNNLPPGVSP